MTAPLLYLTGGQVAETDAILADRPHRGNTIAALRHSARHYRDELGAHMSGSLWERVGGSKGPVNPSRVLVVGNARRGQPIRSRGTRNNPLP